MLKRTRSLAGSWVRATGDAMRRGARTMSPADELRAALAPPAPTHETDPALAAAIAANERAQRATVRAPYRAPHAVSPVVTRLLVGRRDADDALALLAGARPELVFGAYRSPDRLRPTREESQKEWVVIHAPGAMARERTPAPARVGLEPHARGSAPARVELEAKHAWVARGWGDPWPLDEEVAALFLARSGLPPERCLGVHRITRWPNRGEGDAHAETSGVRILHVPDREAERAYDELRHARPVPWPAGSTGPARVDLLWWTEIREAVRPRVDKPPPAPNPAPRLPVDPEELLGAYLEVVGVNPADCWGVGTGVSRRAPEDAGSRWPGSGRWHVTDLVSLIYRDRPEYEEGRRRFARYAIEQLPGSLAHPHADGETPPLEKRGAVERAIDLDNHGESGFLWVGDQSGAPPYC